MSVPQDTSIQAQLDQIRTELGQIPDFQRDGYFDNPVHARMHELGVAIDRLEVTVAGFDDRLEALEQKGAPVVVGAGAIDVLAVLRSAGVFITNGRVGLGGEPVQDTDALLTVYGGQILGKNVGNWQNPGAVIENLVDLANSDGGIRFLQYVRYFEGKPIRSAPTRPVNPRDLSKGMEANPSSIFAIFDSHGDTCVSDSRVPYGQVFYLVKSPENGTLTLASYHPEIQIRLRNSSVYGAADKPVSPT